MLERAPSHGVGMQICVRLVDGGHLAGYSFQGDVFGATEIRDNSGMNDQKKKYHPTQ